MNREILPKVKTIITHSMKEAKNFEDVKVRPEHILLSIMNDDDNEASKIINTMNLFISHLWVNHHRCIA